MNKGLLSVAMSVAWAAVMIPGVTIAIASSITLMVAWALVKAVGAR